MKHLFKSLTSLFKRKPTHSTVIIHGAIQAHEDALHARKMIIKYHSLNK